MNHEAIKTRRKNASGKRSATGWHKMSDTVIGETLMTGTTDMIDVGIIMDGTRDTSRINPLVTTNDGKITVDMMTNPSRVPTQKEFQ